MTFASHSSGLPAVGAAADPIDSDYESDSDRAMRVTRWQAGSTPEGRDSDGPGDS